MSQQSPDASYCKDCFDFLRKEAKQDSCKKNWHPDPDEYPVGEPVESTRRLGQTLTPPPDSNTEMSQKVERDKKIWELHCQGLSSRKIAEGLRRSGIQVSYKTVQRILRDKRHNS